MYKKSKRSKQTNNAFKGSKPGTQCFLQFTVPGILFNWILVWTFKQTNKAKISIIFKGHCHCASAFYRLVFMDSQLKAQWHYLGRPNQDHKHTKD